MGYRISIGEKYVHEEEGQKTVYAEEVRHEDAPQVPSTSNVWEPSYSGMADFEKHTGLKDLFKELIPEHPGFCKLKKDHLVRLETVNYLRLNINDRARLSFLHFWIKWALANCKNPVIANT